MSGFWSGFLFLQLLNCTEPDVSTAIREGMKIEKKGKSMSHSLVEDAPLHHEGRVYTETSFYLAADLLALNFP